MLSNKRLALLFFLIAFVPAAVCAFFHLRAPVDLAKDGITWIHGISAVFANWFGPWAVLIVRLVDFPNAGTRSFNLPLALGLTAILAALLFAAFRSRLRLVRIPCLVIFAPFSLIWFGIGLIQIADGLL